MRQLRVHEQGTLSVDEVTRPVAGAGELLVAVEAIGVTLPAVRLARGSDTLPHAPGADVAGRVAALGPGVTGWKIGQRVVGLAFTGGYAEFVSVAAPFLTPVPDRVPVAAALALVRGGQVASGALWAAGIHKGDRVLITAAAGGVGHLAVQLARSRGAGRVIGAVGSADKAAFVRGLGADEVIEYGEIGGEIGGEVDVVLDSVGGAAQTRAINTLAPFGKLVSYGAAGAPVDVNELRLHARTVIGFAMAPFATRHPELYDRHRLELWDRYANGELIPAIHTTLALERAAEAHRIIESRRNQGKVILTP